MSKRPKTCSALRDYVCDRCHKPYTAKNLQRKYRICPACRKLPKVKKAPVKKVAARKYHTEKEETIVDVKIKKEDWCCVCGTGTAGVYCKECFGKKKV